ncbi:PhzF family phenazine biosynthesis protein [Amycolatopsis sp. DSM 110486]|uniref:PhzF family phenazine biosynthesis protein n=1 Tax=Amycolatopsis sp. DSM 110486 TaxID=2865832 RepID=UPI001C6A8D09|nr:PhzF family phenazine biosynthesis protein [Amycolatopsis sp. DSM 110486]QYN23377.1 PhzF family phenazine biosynthesis protein [Amycolatopsis sp. DSM 110486]
MRFYVVDAFTGEAFAGNPAGVVVLERDVDAAWMQQVAGEMKHSETAFVRKNGTTTSLRWFTPATEVDLCGHATIAATQVLGGTQTYETRSGILRCTKHEDGWIEMDFPVDEPRETQEDVSRILADEDVKPLYVGRSRENLFVELETPEQVARATPDLTELKSTWTGRMIITASGDPGEPSETDETGDNTDFVSRFFGPGVGVDEDPVTGSAHCALAPYWARKLGRKDLTGKQISQRGGIVKTELDNDRVRISGRAVTVVSGELHV